MPPSFDTRVGAYGVVVQGGKVLLAHWNERGMRGWTLPGGGLEAGEDPATAAVREILEETGYHVRLGTLLGLDSFHLAPEERLDRVPRRLHSLRVIYAADVVGGALRREVDGSTDDVAWFDLSAVPALPRVGLVDVALELWRARHPAQPAR